MLRSLKDLQGDTIHAKDGDIGKVDEFFFDDHSWTVRYLVANTGNWLTGTLVLISPQSIEEPDRSGKKLNINLTKDQIEHSPSVSTDEPVSRQREMEFNQYYGWMPYWGTASTLPGYVPPTGMTNARPIPSQQGRETQAETQVEPGDPNLQSSREVAGYGIAATDGDIGEVEDFVVDDVSWKIRYLIVDTHRWLPGKKVLIAPRWIREVVWEEASVTADLPKEKIKNAPEYDPGHTEITREYEEKLHGYYEQTPYWEQEAKEKS